jgi:alkylated DNA repair dioxygenase AlkB
MDLLSTKEFLRSSGSLAWKIPELRPSILELSDIQTEVSSVPEELFYPQVSNQNHLWDQLVLRGIGPDKVGHHTRYGYSSPTETPWRWVSENCDQLRHSVLFVKRQFSFLDIHRVALHSLGPGGKISAHKDDLKGIDAAFLVAISWPRDCMMFIDESELPIQNGDVLHINYMRSHSVQNFGDSDRWALSIMGRPKNRKQFYDLILKQNHRCL